MKAVNQRSSTLIIIVACLLFLISSSGLYTIYLTKIIEADTMIVNKLGTIRGTMQRLVKLELQGEQSDPLIKNIDKIVEDFNADKIKLYDQARQIRSSLHNLEAAWIHIKTLIYEYRTDPSGQNLQNLLNKSEDIWDEADHMVFISELVSKKKMGGFTISFLLFIVNGLLILVIIYFIKKYVKDHLEHAVNYDPLTKIFNRSFYKESLKNELYIASRYHKDVSLMIFDIDHFKNVNDTHGHDVGDYILFELAKIVGNHIRKSDILARIGGEEFAIIIPETDISNAVALAEKIRKIIENYTFKYVDKITVSIGITSFQDADTIDTIFKRADIALYKAKINGRNRCESVLPEICM